MDNLTQLIDRKYTLARKPQYQGKRCVSSRSFGEECDICVRLCPTGQYKPGRTKCPDYEQCEKCCICAAVCPHGAIAPTDSSVRAFMMALAGNGELSVGCEKDEDAWNLSVSCLAALSWEQIAIAAIRRNGIVVSMRRCETCEHKEFETQFRKHLDRAKRFLGKDLFSRQVRILKPGDIFVQRRTDISRRELLTFFKRLPLNTVLGLLPKDEGLYGGSFYRAVLRDRIRELYEENFTCGSMVSEPETDGCHDDATAVRRHRYEVSLPLFNSRCYNCGLCARQCPRNALEFISDPDSGFFSVTVEAWRCTSCGICRDVCREHAISGIRPMAVPHIGKVILKRIAVRYCECCGKPCKPSSPDGLCDLCRIHVNVEKRKHEGRGNAS